MGFSDSIRRNMPGAPSSIAKHMLKHYLEAKTRYPHFSEEQIFSKMLMDRYAVIKGMSVDDMKRVLSQTDTLVELTMAVIEHENPSAMSETYREETARDIFSFFVENEMVEFEKFRQRPGSGNAEENNQADTHRIESQISSLIGVLELSDFENLETCIVLNKDYSVAYRVGPIVTGETIAKVSLEEVPEYSLIQLAKKGGGIGAALAIDMFAKNALAILLKRAKNAKGTDDPLAAGDEAIGKEDLRQMLDSQTIICPKCSKKIMATACGNNIVCPGCRADYPPEAVMPDEKVISETSSKPVNSDVFTENAKNRGTSQSINDQEYNNFSCPSGNKSLRINKSFVSGIASVVVVLAVILLATVVKTELAQEQSNFEPSPQQMTSKEAGTLKYDNPLTNGIEQKHSLEKVEDTYKLGYERGLTLVRKLATNDDAKINMLCDEVMKEDHIANFLYLKGCVNGYKSYFGY